MEKTRRIIKFEEKCVILQKKLSTIVLDGINCPLSMITQVMEVPKNISFIVYSDHYLFTIFGENPWYYSDLFDIYQG